jgi:nucleoside-diphosphate-sugar epimerase
MEAVNVNGTKTLFDAADGEGVEFFCHLSSVGVIGRTRLPVVDEDAPCNPMNEYERTKFAAEQAVSRGLSQGRVVILRPTNVFDAATLQEMLGSSFLKRVEMFVKGRESTHLVYVEDVAAAAVFFLDATTESSVDKFIVSSDEERPMTYRDLQSLVASITSKAVPRARLSAPPAVPYWIRRLRRGSTNFGTIIYSSGMLRRAGFEMPYGVAAGIRDAFARAVQGA